MNQKNNRKWMAGALLLTAGLCFVPGKTVSARMEVNSYGELTVCTDSPVVTIRGNISSIRLHDLDRLADREFILLF